MSLPDIPQEAINELHRRYSEDLNSQVRALLTGAGFDVERLIEEVENRLESDEVKRARSLLLRVLPDPVVPLLSVRRHSLEFYELTLTEPKRHNTPIVNGVVAKVCAECGAKFDMTTEKWSKGCG